MRTFEACVWMWEFKLNKIVGVSGIIGCIALFAFKTSWALILVTQPAPNSGSAYISHQHECLEDNGKGVPCPDSVEMDNTVQHKIRLHFENGFYTEIDKLYDAYRSGTERFKDGRWKLAKLEQALENGFNQRDSWKKDLERLKDWQAKNPKSFIAKFAEASYWRAYAWKGRGTKYSKDTPKEAWELFEARLNNSLNILSELYPEAVRNPSWYPMMIRVALSLGAQRSQIRAIFDEGQKRFPQYHSIYLAMAITLEPRWGGSTATYDGFAREAAKLTADFEGDGMYARIYWAVDFEGMMPFKNGATSPTWKSLKSAFDSLEVRYTNSEHNRNQFAHVACRTNDSVLYRKIRSRLGIYANEASFTVTPLDACDAKHGWSATK
jgi:Domain of unknown function (DUF4034)